MAVYKAFIIFNIIKILISFPVCQDNANYCKNCNILTNLCFKCQIPEIFTPDEEGGCVGAKRCNAGKNFCLECEREEKLCNRCEESYYKDENGGCAYSEGCEISYKGECLKCKDGYILIGKENDFRFCKSLSIDNFKNCNKINYEKGVCEECDEGYYLTSGDFKCIKTENCRESVFGNCVKCDANYYYDKKENKCKLKDNDFKYCKQSINGKSCEICEDDYYMDEKGICIQTQFCSESENLVCKKCKSGYYLSQNNICTSTDNCQLANSLISVCTLCDLGFYLDKKNYKCKSNTEENTPYKYCQEVVNSACSKCEIFYFLGEDLKCSNTPNCEKSENGICEKCIKNYHLGKDNKCNNIDKCIYSNFGICIECEDGYYYDKYNSKCVEEKGIFLNCKSSCDEGDKCCECKDNFYLYENDSLCYDNTEEEEFIKCSKVNVEKDKCTMCHEGYYLGSENNKCSKVERCKIVENENKCLECDTFYCLDVKNQECIDNDYLDDINKKFYISCNRTNEEGTACESCIEGYKLNDEGICVDINYCDEEKDGKCLKCKDILSVNSYQFCANEIFGCIESAKMNCLRCDNLENLYECTECKEGYQKTTLGCIKFD